MSFAKGNILYRHQGDEAGRLGRLSEEIYPDANWFFSEVAVFFFLLQSLQTFCPLSFSIRMSFNSWTSPSTSRSLDGMEQEGLLGAAPSAPCDLLSCCEAV